MSDSETPWVDAFAAEPLNRPAIAARYRTDYEWRDFARRLERLCRVQQEALIELRSGLDERSYRRLLRGELTASVEADRQYDSLRAELERGS